VSGIAQVVGLLDEGILVGIPIKGAGNFAQSVAALNRITGHCRAVFAIVCQQFLQRLLQIFTLSLGASQGRLINGLIQIDSKVLLDHNPPPENSYQLSVVSVQSD
jgi:hypothetical protein